MDNYAALINFLRQFLSTLVGFGVDYITNNEGGTFTIRGLILAIVFNGLSYLDTFVQGKAVEKRTVNTALATVATTISTEAAESVKAALPIKKKRGRPKKADNLVEPTPPKGV